MEHQIKHIAIIPDGNRRWAKAKGVPAVEGHRYAADIVFPQLYDTVKEYGIPYCTFWALSPENFTKRSPFEVRNLLFLLQHFLKTKVHELNEKNIRMNIIGDIEKLPAHLRDEIEKAIDNTKQNTSLTLTFAINYGGRDEMLRAINKWHSGNPDKNLSKEQFSSFLDTADMPDPDLIIRTGGEQRTSGFMLWQSEYTEYAFADKLFPDFTPDDMKVCIEEFLHRKRRFGK